MKKATIFFDVEADIVSQSTDNKKCLERILSILNEKKTKAVFNSCGKVVEQFPEFFKKAANSGHEISSHCYNHENVLIMEKKDLQEMLLKTEKIIFDETGQKIAGIRSPWLYYNPAVYQVYSECGYRWVSNKRVRRKEIANHPSFQSSGIQKFFVAGFASAAWNFFPKAPFLTNGMLEIPLLSSMDGELFGQIDPNQKSTPEQLDFVANSIQKQFFECKNFFNATFHDWIIGSSNRIVVLEKTLDFLKKEGCQFALARELLQ